MARSFYQVVNSYFYRAEMEGAMHSAELEFLTMAGALLLDIAASSIVKSDKTSQPGRPPHGHGQELLRKRIKAAVDAKQGMVVGPINTSHRFRRGDGRPTRGTVPQVLEQGGEVFVTEVYKWGRWRRISQRSRDASGLPTRIRKAKVKARPYMAPALRKAQPRLAGMWRGLFRRR